MWVWVWVCFSLNSFNLQSPQSPCLLCHRAPVKHPSLGWFSHCSHGQPATSCLLAYLCSLHCSTFSSICHYCSLSGFWNVSPAAEDVQSKGGRYQKIQEIRQLQAELAGETKDSDTDFRTQGTVENPCCPSPVTILGPACEYCPFIMQKYFTTVCGTIIIVPDPHYGIQTASEVAVFHR